jgi:antitoxin VapB
VYTEAAMAREYRAKAFKSGNSVALRVPKGLGIEAGTEMTVREEAGTYVFEPVQEKPDRIDLTGIWGSIPWLKPFTDEEREIEPRELDWEGKLLRRD